MTGGGHARERPVLIQCAVVSGVTPTRLPLALLFGVLGLALGLVARARGARGRDVSTSWISALVAVLAAAGVLVDLSILF